MYLLADIVRTDDHHLGIGKGEKKIKKKIYFILCFVCVCVCVCENGYARSDALVVLGVGAHLLEAGVNVEVEDHGRLFGHVGVLGAARHLLVANTHQTATVKDNT